MSRPDLHLCDASGMQLRWTPTTLRQAGKGEQFLEDAIAADFSVLALDAQGLRLGDAKTFRQVRLTTPDGRNLRADVVAVTRSGQLVVIEVKRLGNPELQGRAVIAQVVDYVATAAAMPEGDLVGTLSAGHTTWDELVRATWPDEPHPDWLAGHLRRSIADGRVVIVVACDVVPDGVAEMVRAVANQQALAFELRIVEVTPFVCTARPDEVLLQAHHAVATQIIARTVVLIRNEAGTDRVSVQVEADDAERIEQNVQRPSTTTRFASLAPVAAKLGLTVDALVDELLAIHEAALRAEWPQVDRALLRVGEERKPYVKDARTPGFLWGRFGVTLNSGWRPSVFVGEMIDGTDHRVPLCRPVDGADFTVLLSVAHNRDNKRRVHACLAGPGLSAPRRRLNANAGRWVFHDSLASRPPQIWHPIHVRRPLADVFAGTSTAVERRDRWFAAATEGLDLLLDGDEMAVLRQQLDVAMG
jgi:hypothetical protein